MDVTIVQETCPNCNILFWISKAHQERLVSTKEGFFCPNGHSASYTGESDKAKIARLIAEKNQMIREKGVLQETIKTLSAPKKRGRPKK